MELAGWITRCRGPFTVPRESNSRVARSSGHTSSTNQGASRCIHDVLYTSTPGIRHRASGIGHRGVSENGDYWVHAQRATAEPRTVTLRVQGRKQDP